MIEITQSLPQHGHDKGLLTGDSGILLLLHYYSKWGDKSFDKELEELETNCINSISEGEFSINGGYCSGLSGILEVFNHLNEQKLSEISTSDADEIFMSYLWRKIKIMMAEEKYDFLYGLIGMIQPFFHFRGGEQYIYEVIDEIYNSAEKNGDIISFPFRNIFTSEKESNLSISHGVVSVVNFIIKAYNQGINKDVCRVLIYGLLSYFLTQKIDRTQYNSCYPNVAIDNRKVSSSRLGWCYGDLSIALMFWEAAKAIDNQSWKNEAINIFDFACTRRDLEKNLVTNAYICHGTSGIALIFNRIYRETKFQRYKDARDYWVSKTLALGEKEGYRTGGDDTAIGILGGLTGVGLMLLACLNEKKCACWDKLLFIN